MITIEKYRSLMGQLAEGLTDEELSELLKHHYRIVDAIFDWCLRRRASHKADGDSPGKP